MTAREARIERRSNETAIELELRIDGSGQSDVRTGLGMLDHMLATLARHARFDLRVQCEGDTWVDDHHSAEDCAIVLGRALDQILGDRRGIRRFGTAYAPLDEALARVVIDLSGRPMPVVDLGLRREKLGEVACENFTHFFVTLAMESRCALHVDVLRGRNDHHRVEAAFKALALALREALSVDSGSVPSTKGVLG